MDRAIRCCENAVDQAVRPILDASSAIVEAVGGGQSLALVPVLPRAPSPGTLVTPAPVQVTLIGAGELLPIGAVILIGAVALDNLLDTLGRVAAAEMLQGIANGIRTANRQKGSFCEACMRRNQLPQGPDRKRFRRVVRSRRP